jgi:predicted ATPase
MLVVFDNAEELLYHDKRAFRELITELLGKCPCLTFLITSRIVVGVLQDIVELVIVLHELKPDAAVDLLISRAQNCITH